MTRGVIYYNKGTKCLIRLTVSLHSLRKYYNGPVTIVSNGEDSHRYCRGLAPLFKADFKEVDLTYIPPGDSTVFLETTLASEYTPYDTTIWLDSDTLVRGPINDLFDIAEKNEIAVPHFAGWSTQKGNIAKRIKFWDKWYPDLIDGALNFGPAVNCGIIAFRRDSKFMKNWYEHTLPGRSSFIPNETCMQVILHKYPHKIVPGIYNCSCKYGPVYDNNTRVIHYHGRKHVRVPKPGQTRIPNGGDLWISEFEEVMEKNVHNIRDLIPGDDKQLRQYLMWKKDPEKYHSVMKELKGEKKPRRKRWTPPPMDPITDRRMTIVTGVTPNYFEKLKLTLPTWKIKKQLTDSPLIIFHHGFSDTNDLKKFVDSQWPNNKLIHWDMPKYESMRELMLSAFVFGAAAEVETPYTVKLDCDSFFLDDRDLFLDHMFGYDAAGHKWRYTKPGNWIAILDDWASRNSIPGEKYLKQDIDVKTAMESRRYGHKRFASWICLQKTSLLVEAAAYAGNERLPVPSHDTFIWYMATRLPGKKWCWHNFKKMGAGTHTNIAVVKERVNA